MPLGNSVNCGEICYVLLTQRTDSPLISRSGRLLGSIGLYMSTIALMIDFYNEPPYTKRDPTASISVLYFHPCQILNLHLKFNQMRFYYLSIFCLSVNVVKKCKHHNSYGEKPSNLFCQYTKSIIDLASKPTYYLLQRVSDCNLADLLRLKNETEIEFLCAQIRCRVFNIVCLPSTWRFVFEPLLSNGNHDHKEK